MASPSAGTPVGRNDPCPCGSGRKYKKCCLGKADLAPAGVERGAERGDGRGAEAHLAEAIGHFRGGHLETGIRSLRLVLRADPRHEQALFLLGRSMGDLGRPEEGLEFLRRLVAVNGDRAEYHAHLGGLCFEARRPEEAAAAAERARELDPRDLLALGTLAACYERSNRLEDALEAASCAMEIDPGDTTSVVTWVRLQRRAGNLDEGRVKLESVLAREERPAARAEAFGELGMVLDRLGAYDEAFEAFCSAGNEERQRAHAMLFDEQVLSRRIAQYRAGATPDLLARWTADDLDDGHPAPTFLVGFARSGTTLMEQVLAAHPSIVTSDESPLLRSVRDAMSRMFGDREGVISMIEQLDLDRTRSLRRLYWEQVESVLNVKPGEKLVVDKDPLNIVEIALINVIFPEARVIVALRDPRDVCLSCFMQSFRLNAATINFRSIERTAEFYAEVMQLWLDLRHKLSLPFVEVRYEDLVDDTEGQTRRLIDLLGLPWHDDVRRFAEKSQGRFVSTPSDAAVREPVHRRAVERWRKYEKSLAPVAPTLQPFVDAFGYG